MKPDPESQVKWCKLTFRKFIFPAFRILADSRPDVAEVTFGWIDAEDRDASIHREVAYHREYGWTFVRCHAVPEPPPCRKPGG